MAIKEVQDRIDNWIKKQDIGYWEPEWIVVKLQEEIGELAREVNHSFGPKKKKSSEKENSIEAELGDIIHTISCLANKLDIDLDEAFDKTMSKIETRDKDRWKIK